MFPEAWFPAPCTRLQQELQKRGFCHRSASVSHMGFRRQQHPSELSGTGHFRRSLVLWEQISPHPRCVP